MDYFQGNAKNVKQRRTKKHGKRKSNNGKQTNNKHERRSKLKMSEQKTLIERNYEIEKFIINRETIENFEILVYRRLISDRQVDKICIELKHLKNPIGILIVNKKSVYLSENQITELMQKLMHLKNANDTIIIEDDKNGKS